MEMQVSAAQIEAQKKESTAAAYVGVFTTFVMAYAMAIKILMCFVLNELLWGLTPLAIIVVSVSIEIVGVFFSTMLHYSGVGSTIKGALRYWIKRSKLRGFGVESRSAVTRDNIALWNARFRINGWTRFVGTSLICGCCATIGVLSDGSIVSISYPGSLVIFVVVAVVITILARYINSASNVWTTAYAIRKPAGWREWWIASSSISYELGTCIGFLVSTISRSVANFVLTSFFGVVFLYISVHRELELCWNVGGCGPRCAMCCARTNKS